MRAAQPRAVNAGPAQAAEGVKRSPRWPARCAAVYLVQGLLGLSRLAVFTFFKDDLRLDPAEVGFLTGLGFAPWVSELAGQKSLA